MKYLISHVGLFLLGFEAVTSTTSDPHKLIAVSHKHIAQALYRRVKADNPNNEAATTLDVHTKKRICHHTGSSAYHRGVMDEKPVRLHKYYKELRELEPEIFKLLYEPAATNKSTNRDVMIYTNRNRIVDVQLTEDEYLFVKESVFACVNMDTKESDDDVDFYHYDVSEEYNLSDTPDSHAPGRFLLDVFYAPEKGIVARVGAVAEVPARSLSASPIDAERSYWQNRKGNQPTENPSDDPVCKLSELERLRVCTLVLNSEYFKDELTFVPMVEYVERTGCTRQEITFLDEQVQLEANGVRYDEWMIGCEPEEFYDDEYQAEYFVSRVYGSENEVFVYRSGGEDEVVVENRFGDIRFKI